VNEFGLPEYTPPDPGFWAAMTIEWTWHVRFCREVARLVPGVAVAYADSMLTAEVKAVACDMKRRRDLRRVTVSENA
jgi:hypothetical protein